jgi:hypothetical protein
LIFSDAMSMTIGSQSLFENFWIWIMFHCSLLYWGPNNNGSYHLISMGCHTNNDCVPNTAFSGRGGYEH